MRVLRVVLQTDWNLNPNLRRFTSLLIPVLHRLAQIRQIASNLQASTGSPAPIEKPPKGRLFAFRVDTSKISAFCFTFFDWAPALPADGNLNPNLRRFTSLLIPVLHRLAQIRQIASNLQASTGSPAPIEKPPKGRLFYWSR